MEKIINKLINDFTEGVDTYTHNGSTWLIFTESKQWVIELTDSKTLWYNYNFFKGIFSYTSMDVVDNQRYITKWVEDNVINKELTYTTLFRDARDRKQQFEDALQNGVIKTKGFKMRTDWSIEDTIENGIKETRSEINITEGEVDDIIQDGVRDISPMTQYTDWQVEEIIENGVKLTQFNDNENKSWIEGVIKKGVKKTLWISVERESLVEKTINNGVKETNPVDVMKFFNNKMEDTLKNGVKETKQKKNALLILDTNGRELILESHLVVRDGVKETSHRQFLKTYDVKDTIQDGTEHDRWILDGCNDPVDEVLDNGVKETNYDTDNYTDDVKEVIREGVRTSHPRQYVGEIIIDKVIDNGVIETHDDVYHHKGRIDGVIKNGVKETKEMLDWVCTDRMLSNILENGVKETHREICEYKETIDYIIQTGIKETKTPGNGDIVSTVEWMKENNSNSYPKMIDDVIENGVKEVVSYDEHKRGPVNTFGYIDDIIKEGEKINGTYAGGQRQSEKCKSVVEYGTKNPTD